jgi:hypothetical protein
MGEGVFYMKNDLNERTDIKGII